MGYFLVINTELYLLTRSNILVVLLSILSMCIAIIRFRSYNLIGLTGGIGCGKSTLSRQLEENLKAPIIDCDKIAHRTLTPGHFSYKLIVRSFGVEILDQDGNINRKKLGEIIFNDKRKKAKLEMYTHPFIFVHILWSIYNTFIDAKHDIAILDIPLLFETKLYLWFVFPSVVIYIKDPEELMRRIMLRDDCTEEVAQKRIDNQMPVKIKLQRAEICVDNSGRQEEVYAKFQAEYTTPGLY